MHFVDNRVITTSGSHPTMFTPPRPSITHNPTRIQMRTRATSENGSSATKPISEMSFYELLGIPQTVRGGEIKKAYKEMARVYHPDVSPPECVVEYTQRFIRVQEAYETLSDPSTRALYDRHLARGLHLAFSARKKMNYSIQEMEDKSMWRSRWEEQLMGLKQRKKNKEAAKNMSWGDRMRQQRNESSSSSSSP